MRRWLAVCLALAGASLGGCVLYPEQFAGNAARHESNSSLVDFLYPEHQLPPRENSVPELHLPLRVGLAFLPAHGSSGPGPDAALREELLERVRQRFKDRKFVSEIVLIPDYYLSGRGGFDGLAAVQRLYGADLMALVSYDQVMHGDANEWSIGYVTIVGAYLLKGNRYDVATLVDLAVVDPASRSLVLRAGGTDVRHGNATLANADLEERQKSGYGFSAAADQMIEHFDTALNGFESEVRAGHANVRVVHKDGSGGGAIGLLELSLLGAWRLLSRGRRTAQDPAERRSAA